MSEFNLLFRRVMSTKTKSATTKKVKECKCLVCDEQAAQGLRGLCKTHYYQFNHAWRKRKTKAAKADFELEQIKKGHVLPANRGKRATKSVFES